MKKIGFIGFGNMGRAIANSLKNNYEITAYDSDLSKLENLNYKINIASSIKEVIQTQDIVILALKPQVLTTLWHSLQGAKAYISIAAGLTLNILTKNLKSENIVRFMPNIGASTSTSVTAIAINEKADFADEAFKIAESFGSAFTLKEDLFSSFIGISGSGIAYVFKFIHALALSGVKNGISYSESQNIICETIQSALSLLKNDTISPIEHMIKVCSPGGTTIEAVNTLDKLGFDNAIIQAATEACNKSKELEKLNEERI